MKAPQKVGRPRATGEQAGTYAIYSAIGRRIRDERRARKLTQRELASTVSLARASIANIELGRQKLLVHTFLQIARALEVRPTELLPEEGGELPRDLGVEGLARAYRGPGRDWVLRSMSRSARER